MTDPTAPTNPTPASPSPDSTMPPVAIEPPDKDDILKKLDAAQARLQAIVANAPQTTGLTQPDPGGTEQWNGAQVWAHMAEFVPYWQQQLANVIGAYGGAPVAFGRTKDDPARVGAVMAGANGSIPTMMAQVQAALQMTREYLNNMTPEQWAAIGMHARRGEMTVPQMLQAFTVDHLNEHAEQLEALV